MNTLTTYWLLGFGLMVFFYYVLNILNLNKLKKKPVPVEFKKLVNQKEAKNIVAYTIEKSRLGLIEYGVDKIVLLFVLFGGFLSWWAGYVDLMIPNTSPIHAGLIFFFGIMLFSMIVNIPFSLYSSFVIEEKYGFNKQTLGTWIADFFKGLLLMIILGGILLSTVLAVVYYTGDYWWLSAWIVIFGVGLSLQALYPVLIAPLFNKFTPLENKKFVEQIQNLFKKAGIKTEGIYKMDASRRSKHSNAYFTGLGKTKRVVLFDTLLQDINEKEILAVLAHEIGHWKRKHTLRSMILSQTVSLIFFYLASLLIKHPLLYDFALISNIEPYVGLLLLTIIWGPVSFFLSPCFAWLSRKFEYEADEYCIELNGDKESFKSGLFKLYKENLSNLNPHPWFEGFFYSHPSPVRRFEAVDRL